ncbi:MAG: hypothetical protein Fur0046_25140 [Cyanobacteria bacterium J069]
MQGDRYLSKAEAERQRREQLEEFLRSHGFDPDQLPPGPLPEA